MNLFTYGSLMIPSVMYAATGRHFTIVGAYLNDYARFKLKGESYPGIIQKKGAVTEGILHLDVDNDSLMLLDDFEGEFYERVSVEVEIEESGVLAAATYVIKPEEQNRLSKDLWDPQEFEKSHLQDFIENHKGFFGLRKQL